jgi:hypothetical protein
MLILMTAYEVFKQFLFPEIGIWESHVITIIFSSISAATAAYYIFKKQHGYIKLLYDKERETSRLNNELQAAITKLESSKFEVKTLSKLLPICSSCKNIRSDKGYWSKIEAYLADHSGLYFSHSLCPDCARKLYPDLELE